MPQHQHAINPVCYLRSMPVRTTEESEKWWQQLSQYLLFTLAALAISGFYRYVLPVNQTTVALSFLILIFLTAFRRKLVYSLYLSILCTLLYNFFFLPPVDTFHISDPQNLIALLAFLAASFVVNRISARERRQAKALAVRQSEVEQLYEFSQRLMLEDRPRQLLSQAVPALVAESFQSAGRCAVISPGIAKEADEACYLGPGTLCSTTYGEPAPGERRRMKWHRGPVISCQAINRVRHQDCPADAGVARCWVRWPWRRMRVFGELL